ncbi:MAG: 5-formyltetrahydrofolate cyclo-ligase [Prevotella sp.]|nr:5-formyltetrahydrofolate cyclo-ligase [Prevotella sp.]
MSTIEAKRVLRKALRKEKQSKSVQDLAEQSTHVCTKLLGHPSILAARTILAYHSLSDEIDTHRLLDLLEEQGKCVILPQVTGPETMILRRYKGRSSLVEGAFGIMEPIGAVFSDYSSIDVAIVPGMAFDRSLHRLGRGRGYYDRLLPQLPNAFKIGVCFDFQLMESVPHDEYDVVMEEVIEGSLPFPSKGGDK